MSTDPDSQQETSDPEASQQPDQGDKSIDKKSDGAVNPPAQEKQNPNASSELIVLSPHYDEKHHGLYVEKLEQAVRNPKVRNIALNGGYGTGKSSVIQGLVEKIHSSKELKKIRPITISLPTIQIADDSDSKDDRTDRIQREIVKQLLYRSNPRKMRGSQYRRITHVTTAQRATACFIVAIPLTFAFWLLAKPDWHWSQGGSLWGYWQPAVVQTILWGLTFYVDWMWVNKPALKGLQLGPAKLELEKNDSSYFDKYLNEIIYYFEVSGTNLVIFEDLDRFDNPYIFDALHELNELINISLGQERFIEQKNPSVKFLYATRDSIFEHRTKGIVENDAARHIHRREVENRTKFFDVIVPIVPFSTSHNAYEYLKQLIDNSAFPIAIDRKLLEIVGSEISDYRLLANIVSEFQVFAEQIFTSWGNNKETAEFFKDHANYLFAFVTYKNTHLTEYEKIRTGESAIDKINKRFSIMKSEINIMSQTLLQELGDALREKIDEKYKVHSIFCRLFFNKRYFDNFSDVELWEEGFRPSLGSKRNSVSLINYDGNIISDNIIHDFGGNIFVEITTNKLTNKSSVKTKDDCREIITNLKLIHSIDDIFSFLCESESTLPENIQNEIDNFEDFLNKIYSSDPITANLISCNYIDSNFHAYASVFTEGFNNIKVFNFLTQNVGTQQPDTDLRITKQEVKEIVYQIRHNRDRYSNLKGALNADLMLHLTNEAYLFIILNSTKSFFKSHSPKNKELRIKLINAILNRLPDERNKESNYFSSNTYSYNNIKTLLREIIPLYPNIFLECFKNNLTKKQKYLLIDSALNTSEQLPTTMDTKQYINNNIQDIILHIKSANFMTNWADEDAKNTIDRSLFHFPTHD
ncbi:hypothetical protein [Corynebacterium matruchotii]|uniref:YobI family P-loop NTPase n=1 Tax=Corynebacterium matruchotii TaxID=43768 RepID=UPI0028EF62CD|nr:hypothetical protein [Corynebacterium matruchotii]